MSNNIFYPSLELFGFGGPKDGETRNDNIFGLVTYIKKLNVWNAPNFLFNYIPKEFSYYNNQRAWYGTYIDDPIDLKKQVLGAFIISLIDDPKMLSQLLTFAAQDINAEEEKTGVFGATCNVDSVVKGKDNRFYFYASDLAFSKNMNAPIFDLYIVFNRRMFHQFIWTDSTGSHVCTYVPESPTILSKLVPFNSNTANKLTSSDLSITKVELSDILKSGSAVNNLVGAKVIKSLESFTFEDPDVIEGDYDTADTDVSVNAGDTNADVDIKVDLTPDREQKLLKALDVDIESEYNLFGIGGVKHKYQVISDMFKDTYDRLNKSIQDSVNLLFTARDSDVNLGLKLFDTDISTKEEYVDELNNAASTVMTNYLSLKNFVEKDTYNLNEGIRVLTMFDLDSKHRCTSAHMEDRDDILFIVSSLNSSKSKVNLSQITYYMNQMLDNLETNSNKKYSEVNKVLTNVNNSIVNYANLLAQGENFIREFAFYVTE